MLGRFPLRSDQIDGSNIEVLSGLSTEPSVEMDSPKQGKTSPRSIKRGSASPKILTSAQMQDTDYRQGRRERKQSGSPRSPYRPRTLSTSPPSPAHRQRSTPPKRNIFDSGGVWKNESAMRSISLHRGRTPAPVSPTLKESHLEREKLIKENFDLRMRLFYMQEKLNCLDVGQEMPSEGEVRAELYDTQMLLEEKTAELEQTVQLLSKSLTAVDALKNELTAEKIRSQQPVAGSKAAIEAAATKAQIEVDALKDSLVASEDRENELVGKLAGLQAHVDAEAQKRIATEQRSEELERKLDVLEQAKSKLEVEAEEKAAELASIGPVVPHREMEEKIRRVGAKLEEKSELANHAKKRLASAQIRIDELERDIQRRREVASESAITSDSIRRELIELREKYEAHKAVVAAANLREANFQKQIDEGTATNKEILIQLTEVETARAAAEERCRMLRAEAAARAVETERRLAAATQDAERRIASIVSQRESASEEKVSVVLEELENVVDAALHSTGGAVVRSPEAGEAWGGGSRKRLTSKIMELQQRAEKEESSAKSLSHKLVNLMKDAKQQAETMARAFRALEHKVVTAEERLQAAEALQTSLIESQAELKQNTGEEAREAQMRLLERLKVAEKCMVQSVGLEEKVRAAEAKADDAEVRRARLLRELERLQGETASLQQQREEAERAAKAAVAHEKTAVEEAQKQTEAAVQELMRSASQRSMARSEDERRHEVEEEKALELARKDAEIAALHVKLERLASRERRARALLRSAGPSCSSLDVTAPLQSALAALAVEGAALGSLGGKERRLALELGSRMDALETLTDRCEVLVSKAVDAAEKGAGGCETTLLQAGRVSADVLELGRDLRRVYHRFRKLESEGGSAAREAKKNVRLIRESVQTLLAELPQLQLPPPHSASGNSSVATHNDPKHAQEKDEHLDGRLEKARHELQELGGSLYAASSTHTINNTAHTVHLQKSPGSPKVWSLNLTFRGE